jgi:phosphatidylserine decarboxylase
LLTRYGTDVIVAVAVIVALLVVLGIWTDERWVKYVFFAIAAFLTVFTLNFFRDPDRTVNANGTAVESLVISPADGKVVLIKDVEENEYLHSPAKMISIFMSPLNVHVNRNPVNGKVEYLKYIKGKFLVASDDKAANENERQNIGLNSNGKKLMFSQVTGFVARRIVCELKEGENVTMGTRFGMIKFGSRVDVYLPLDAKILVKEGDITTAGETIIANW